MITLTGEAVVLRTVIQGFIQQRKQEKLDKLKPDQIEEREKTEQKYAYHTWLADAARRSGQIQLVTHTIKHQHPDAKGSAINHKAVSPVHSGYVSSATLNNSGVLDVVGNAAALDVYKFLACECEGESLLMYVLRRDKDLIAVFSHPDAEEWVEAFAAIAGGNGQSSDAPRAHQLLKQVYWPLPDQDYHVLIPLYPSVLVQHVYQYVQHHRFSEEAKAARQARKDNLAHPVGTRDFPDLTVQQHGGSKPQNISLLNSQRGGNAYLFASLPPIWQRQEMKPPLKTDSIFARGYFPTRVQKTVNALKSFLTRVQDYKNVAIRNTRDNMVREIIDQLLAYAAQIRTMEPAWIENPDCRLNREECFWLAPGYADRDSEWQKARDEEDWALEIRKRFARWLNQALTTSTLRMADEEFERWQRDLKDEVAWLDREILA